MTPIRKTQLNWILFHNTSTNHRRIHNIRRHETITTYLSHYLDGVAEDDYEDADGFDLMAENARIFNRRRRAEMLCTRAVLARYRRTGR